MTATYTDTLPPTRTDTHAAIDWTPAPDGTGVLVVKQKRAYTTYSVVPLRTDWRGYAFRLVKLTAGTDKEAGAYEVFLGAAGSHCDCKGHQRRGRCKHLDALATIMANGWWVPASDPDYRAAMTNPDADVGPTETRDQPDPGGYAGAEP